MTILLQAIQEYLAEHHPNWWAAPYCNKDNISIMSQHRRTPIIMLDTKHQTITTIKVNSRARITYTDHTLLPQITNIIHQTEQP